MEIPSKDFCVQVYFPQVTKNSQTNCQCISSQFIASKTHSRGNTGVCEVVETLSRRKVDLCCVQETRYRGGHCLIITCKDSRYKLFWSGNSKGTAGVGVFVAEKWIEKVFEVKRVSDRIILVKIIVGQRVLCLLSVYAPQCGLSDSVKDLFYDQLRAVTAMIPASEFLIPCGD